MFRNDDKVYVKLPEIHKLVNDEVNYDHIQVYVYFDQRSKMPTMLVSIVQIKDDRPSGGLFSTSCMIMTAPSGRYPLGLAWARNNAGKLAAHLDSVAQQLENKAGPAWDNVTDFATKNNIKLA